MNTHGTSTPIGDVQELGAVKRVFEAADWLDDSQMFIDPRCSMYGIFTYICVIFGVNVGKYSIHGASGMLTTYRIL